MTELPGSLTDTQSAYDAVGRTIVAQADVLVAVWDGAPAAGRGGTAEVIKYFVASSKPVVWVDATRPRLPRLLIAARAERLPGLPSSFPECSGEPLTKPKLEALAH